MKIGLNPQGYINRLSLSHGSLTVEFGMNEYAIYTEEQGVYKRNSDLHFTQRGARIQNIEGGIVATGIVTSRKRRLGLMHFKNTYELFGNALKVTVERMYVGEVTVFDDSVCFICTQKWYRHYRLYSPSNCYHDGYFVPLFNPDVKTTMSHEPLERQVDTSKPLREQNLFAEVQVGAWAEILGETFGLKFTVLDFTAGERPIHRLVQPKDRSYLEYEFQFDLVGPRHKGDRQKLVLLITPIGAGSSAEEQSPTLLAPSEIERDQMTRSKE